MKAIHFLLAAGIFLLPAYGESAEKKDIHAVMAAEEGYAPVAAEAYLSPAEESALDEEMDELGDASVDADAGITMSHEAGDMDAREAQDAPAAAAVGQGYGSDEGLSADAAAAYDAPAYGDITAIGPVTLEGGDWVFIDGDERRGWFFDRLMMQRNEDGTVSYWQLILYNDFGRAQFVEAMHDEAYDDVAYTLQRRVLDIKKNTIRTYEIIVFDGENTVITDGDRDGHAAEIRPHTMAEKERDAVKKEAKKLKYKKPKG